MTTNPQTEQTSDNTLDEAIASFRAWAEGGKGMDELDLKEYLLETWLPATIDDMSTKSRNVNTSAEHIKAANTSDPIDTPEQILLKVHEAGFDRAKTGVSNYHLKEALAALDRYYKAQYEPSPTQKHLARITLDGSPIEVLGQKYISEKEVLKVLREVIGEDEKLVIPDYPAVDDEGETLWSKSAAKEGRKQVTQRYHNRKELRAEQRKRAGLITNVKGAK